MTPEAVVHRVDLSDDASWDQIQWEDALSQEEKDFLKERFNEESEGIIYLSQQELADLRSIIWIPMDESRNINLNTFITEQTEEWLALSDIVESNEAIPDIIRAQIEAWIDGQETIAREQLFWEEGMFSSLNISDTAQDHMSVSMSLSFMEHGMSVLQQKIDNNSLTAADIEWLIALWEELEQKFATIKDIIDTTEAVPWSTSATMPHVYVAQNGELNKIFMDPSSGVEFFDGIILGDIDASNIKEKLEAGNVDSVDDINVDFQDVSSDLNGSITRMAESINNMTPEQQREMLRALEWVTTRTQSSESSNAWTLPESSKESNDKRSIWDSIMELLRNFFDWIIDLANSGTEGDWWDNETLPDPTETQDPLAAIRSSLLTRLSDWAFIGMEENSLKEFFESETGLTGMTNIIDEIPDLWDQDTTEEKINNLFFTPISSDEWVMKIDAFVAAGSLESYKNADGSVNSENLLSILREYKKYRDAYNDDTSLKYKDYFPNNND